jgi:CRISPR/Cas system-associated exonuclease Cas4 (RecB family)
VTQCARRYYHQYYGSHGGWSPNAPIQARLTYRLKQLTSLDTVLGTAVHEAAKHCVVAVTEGRPFPDYEILLEHVREALRTAWASSSNRAAFIDAPKRDSMLLDAYYGRRVPDHVVARVRDKMEKCVKHLVECPIWEELRACGPGRVIVADTRMKFEHVCADGTEVPVYAAPDLVFLPAGKSADLPSCVVVDWKTGAGEEDGRAQLAVYAMYVREILGVEFPGRGWEERVYALLTGEVRSYALSPADLRSASERINESVGFMRALTADPDRNIPRPMEDFPLTHPRNRHACQRCPYFELCEGELKAAAAAPGRRALPFPVS